MLKTQLSESLMRPSVNQSQSSKYQQHTGFAFSGEEGHVPQILRNLKSY